MAFTDNIDRMGAVSERKWIGRVRGILYLVGVMYIVLGVVGAPLISMGFMNDPSLTDDPVAPWLGYGTGALMFCCSGGFGIFNFIAARGLKSGRKWAWILSLCLGGIYAPSACLPFGALILFGLLQADVRSVFLEDRRLGE